MKAGRASLKTMASRDRSPRRSNFLLLRRRASFTHLILGQEEAEDPAAVYIPVLKCCYPGPVPLEAIDVAIEVICEPSPPSDLEKCFERAG